jgi:hypothetical protein
MAVTVTFVGGPAGRPWDRWAAAARRLPQALVGLLGRLAPPCRPGREADLPPEWFKYPPL